jgi:peptidoglycan/LPS O-acetylase OafA/YrhL
MKKEFSIYLDLVRFVAAIMVVIYHSNIRLLITEKLPFSNHGHAAVIVFFVLSGYVISYITATKEGTPVEYWSSRLSRFYSLAVPVVLLSPLLDLAGEALAPQFYVDKTTHDLAWLRVVTSLLFMNEVWGISIMSFSNVPYWSLCYEMWYYILFAIFTFTFHKTRIFLAAAAMLLLGPKILLLAPIWLLGVVLHRYQTLYRLPQWQGWLLFLASWPLYGIFQHYQLTELGSELLKQIVGEKWHRNLAFSKYFVTDYLLALVVAANFIGFRLIAHHFSRPLVSCEKLIRWASGFTFSLYIFHQPLLQFFAAMFNGDPNGKLFYLQVVSATLLSIIVIGTYTEQKRHHLRRLIRGWLISLVNTRWWRHDVSAALAFKRESR